MRGWQGDYRFVIQTLLQPEALPTIADSSVGAGDADVKGSTTHEMLDLDQVRASLASHIDRYAAAGKLSDALLLVAIQREINDPETATSASRVATIEERRAGEMMKAAEALPESDVAGRAQQKQAALEMLADSAEAYRRHAKLTTMDDVVSGNSLWRAGQLFDQAGRTADAVAALMKFTTERPHDPRVPEGLLAMGRLYQSVGRIDDAIAIYQRNIKENAKTPAAYSSAVNLARCYMVQGPEKFDLAEKSLLSLVQDNLDLGPAANEFRVSLFTLGDLYYTNGRWADAILRLEEATERYPEDGAVPRALFMLAESYRKSAGDIGDAMQKNPAIEHREELAAARVERLHRAASLFARVIAKLDGDEGGQMIASIAPKLSALEEDYLRTSYMDRAECYFELNDLPTAIKFYDLTASRFAQNVMAAESYVQIVNAYVSLNEPARADAAAERAQWVLEADSG